MDNIKYRFFSWVTGHRKTVIIVFLAVSVLSAALKPLVSVNYDMKDYLPEDSSSTIALDVMNQEYEEGVPNARLMIKDVSVPKALEYKKEIENIEGVESVQWLDDSVNPATPVETMNSDLIDEYYKDGNALFQIVISKDKILSATEQIERVAGEESAMTGDAVSTAVATRSTVKEIRMITAFAVIMVLILLVFATISWLEPFIILITIGVAIVINGGTNIAFGEISFVTNAAGSILQLAVSLDYAVFLLHRYQECRIDEDSPAAAMVNALCKSTGSILSSGFTTVIGFMALVLMRFQIGPDLGWALAKGVFISLISVFIFLPAIYLQCIRLLEKTSHRSFLPRFTKLGKLIVRIMLPCAIAFAVVIVPAIMASNSNSYYYGPSKIFGNDTKLGQDTTEIERIYGHKDTYALLLPKGDLYSEKKVSEAISDLDGVTGIVSYVDSVGSEVPNSYLTDDVLDKLNSDEYTRMVISANTGDEGENTFELVRQIKKISQEYYPDSYYLAGTGHSNYDLMTTIKEDMSKVNLLAVLAVFLVLLIMMKSALLPALLVMSIEGAVWINTAIPYFTGNTVFYIAYLIISTVQLGATVDYAILFTERYKSCRLTENRKEAVVSTIEHSVPSILVSGMALTIVGFLLGMISTHGLLAQLGIFIGRGAICSMVIVIFVLPSLLSIFDRFFIGKKFRLFRFKKEKL